MSSEDRSGPPHSPDPSRSEDDNASSEKRVVGPFRIEKQIGVGGMGIVYQATYLKNGAQVALKMLSPMLTADEKLLARFEREMSILKKLKHPHIVRYYGGGCYKNQHYYAMELLTGGTLEDELKERKRLPWERVIEVGIQICEALEHSHNRGIIHRDLKPANMFLRKNGQLKLGDYGIARDTQDTALTAAGRTVGTYAYMAPEQIVGKPAVNRKTDLYALGCVLFELLTGAPPFKAENEAELFMMHIEDDPPSLSTYGFDCPVWLDRLIVRMMSKSQDDRPYDALSVKTTLEEIPSKVAQSIAKASMEGSTKSLVSSGEKTELKKVLKKKKKKKKSEEPFYERGWFLGLCLVVLLVLVGWLMMPMSEAKLIAHIKEGMASEDLDVWRETRSKYIEEYIERFPEGEYIPEVKDHLDAIEMGNAERRLESLMRRNRDPDTEVERRYLEAREFVKFGDHQTAMELYQAIVNVFETQEEARPVVNLAKRELEALKENAGEENRIKAIQDALDRADELYQEGKRIQAESLWKDIIRLYENKEEYEVQIERAKEGLRQSHKE